MKALIMGGMARGRYLGTSLDQPRNDFCRIADGMGVQARRVEKPGDLKPALQWAFDSDRPSLVEVIMESAPKV